MDKTCKTCKHRFIDYGTQNCWHTRREIPLEGTCEKWESKMTETITIPSESKMCGLCKHFNWDELYDRGLEKPFPANVKSSCLESVGTLVKANGLGIPGINKCDFFEAAGTAPTPKGRKRPVSGGDFKKKAEAFLEILRELNPGMPVEAIKDLTEFSLKAADRGHALGVIMDDDKTGTEVNFSVPKNAGSVERDEFSLSWAVTPGYEYNGVKVVVGWGAGDFTETTTVAHLLQVLETHHDDTAFIDMEHFRLGTPGCKLVITKGELLSALEESGALAAYDRVRESEE